MDLNGSVRMNSSHVSSSGGLPVYLTIQVVLSLLTMGANGFAIYLTTRWGDRQDCKRYFVTNMNVANFLAGLAYASVSIITTLGRSSTVACVCVYAAGSSASIACVYSLLAVCWEQVIRFHFPLRHSAWMSPAKIWLIIVMIWTSATADFVIIVTEWTSQETCFFLHALHTNYHVFAFVTIYAVPTVILLASYATIVVAIRKHVVPMARNPMFSPGVCRQTVTSRRQVKLVVTMILMNVALVAAWSPLHIYILVYVLNPDVTTQPTRLLGLIYFTTPLLIPFIYTGRLSSFRSRCFRVCCLHGPPPETVSVSTSYQAARVRDSRL